MPCQHNICVTSALLACVLFTAVPARSSPDSDYCRKIEAYARAGKSRLVSEHSKIFFRKYPRSSHVPDVRLAIAEVQEDPEEAVKRYRVLVEKYRYYSRRDYAQFRICQVRLLQSRWKSLEKESSFGISTFSKSRYITGFRRCYILACVRLNSLIKARRECASLLNETHDYRTMAWALLVMSQIQKKTTGYSRDYINSLREIASGFKRSDIVPSALYWLGDFYEHRNDHNRSYSAYMDLVEKFPGSPESYMAEKRARLLKQYAPVRVEYMPGDMILQNTEDIDIRPERDIPEDRGNEIRGYSLSIGPFYSLKKAGEIKKLVSEFGSVKIVRLMKAYEIYCGEFTSRDSANTARIRMAEELGINARIVHISNGKRKKYIYRD